MRFQRRFNKLKVLKVISNVGSSRSMFNQHNFSRGYRVHTCGRSKCVHFLVAIVSPVMLYLKFNMSNDKIVFLLRVAAILPRISFRK